MGIPRAQIPERWGLPVRRLNQRSFLAAPDLPSAIYLVEQDTFEIPILIRRTDSRMGLFVFHGAKNRDKFAPPVFEGAGVSEQLGLNAILFSDPILALSPNVTIGWFAGSARLPLQEILPTYQQRIAQVLDLQTRVFFGGSGGGFAALYYGLKAEAEVVLPIAPQTIVSRHNRAAVTRYFRTGFGVACEQELPDEVRARFCWDIRNIWPETLRSWVVYLQNAGDQRHMNRHFKPLEHHARASRIPDHSTGPGLTVVLRHWSDDHAPPPKPLVLEQLRRVLASSGTV